MKGLVVVTGKRMQNLVRTCSSREEVYYKGFQKIYADYGIAGIELFMVGIERLSRKGGQFVPSELRLFGIGEFSETQIPLKAILAYLQEQGGVKAVVIHNHPKSTVDTCRPSSQDIKFHWKLQNLLEMSGVELVSSYIVADGGMVEFDTDGKRAVVYRDCSYIKDVVENSPSIKVGLFDPVVAKEFFKVNAKTANGFAVLDNKLAPVELCPLSMTGVISDAVVIQRKMVSNRADRLIIYFSGKQNIPYVKGLEDTVSPLFSVLDAIDLTSNYSFTLEDVKAIEKEADKKARRRK